MDHVKRLNRLQDELAKSDFDALIYGTGANFLYFTGLHVRWHRDDEPHEPTCFLLVKEGEDPQVILDSSWSALGSDAPVDVEVVSSQYELLTALQRYLKGSQRIGASQRALEYICELVRPILPGVECDNAELLGEHMRWIKEPEEIAFLRELTGLTNRVMEIVVDQVRPGITQLQMQKLVAQTGLKLGAEDISFPATVAYVKSGTEPTTDPFVYPPEEGLVPGTSIAFDFGFIRQGYCSDYGRSFYCGNAPDHIRAAYRALQESQLHLIEQMKPGQLKINQMFDVIEAALDERGYGDRIRARLPERGLGHQIGVDLHERPSLGPNSDVWLQPGMVMAIEPKVWHPGEYYLRVEDIVLITKDGAESLTTFDRTLFELPLT